MGVVLSVLVGSVCAVVVEAQRGRRGRRGPPPPAQEVTPHSDGIAGALGGLEWGITRAQLLRRLEDGVRAEWLPRIHKAPGAIEEDRLRHGMSERIARLRREQVEFTGRTTGWDVSFLSDEYTHGNSEAMIVVNDEQAQNFYFFIGDRLWKWYRAFNAEVFEGRNFAQFGEALQGRFGSGRVRTGSRHEGGPTRNWIEWQDDTTQLRAVDETQFYGFYCLVFEDKRTMANLASLRPNPDPRRQRRGTNALIDSVTRPETSNDRNNDIADRLTGNIRRRTDAEQADDDDDSSSDQPAPQQRRRGSSPDPLEGL